MHFLHGKGRVCVEDGTYGGRDTGSRPVRDETRQTGSDQTCSDQTY